MSRALTVLILPATLIALVLTPAAAAQTPAGSDQYLPEAPGGNPGGDGGEQGSGGGGGAGGASGLDDGIAPSTDDGASQGADGGQESTGGSEATNAVAQGAGGDAEAGSTVPFTDYPASDLVLAILALLAAGIAARLAFSGYQRANRSGA